MPEAKLPPNRRPSQTKIVATVGPACEKLEKLVELIQAGVDVFRVNAAHGSLEEHEQQIADIRRASSQLSQPVAILVDLAGPKIRLGELPGGKLRCAAGDQVRFVRGDEATQQGDMVTTYAPLVDELAVGDRVLLADGIVALVVEQVDNDAAVCRVIQSGLLRSRQGVNLPGVKLSVPTLGEQDRKNAVWAAKMGVDFIGLSFVRSASDIHQLKSLIADHDSPAQVVAKIEKPEAVEHLEVIVEAADAVMVARGDLGVEIDIAEVPVVQKRIIRVAHRFHKPVIIATQMLDSMQHSRLPTRAEATDVANAILDGADACMLSGETAIGSYPREAVEVMHRIAMATEPLNRERTKTALPDFDPADEDKITEATAMSAGRLAEVLDAQMILVATATGRTALRLSKDRLFVPTVGVSNSDVVLRRMCLYWGVIPLAGAPTEDPNELMDYVVAQAREAGYLTTGNRVVLLAGTGLAVAEHNMIVVHELE